MATLSDFHTTLSAYVIAQTSVDSVASRAVTTDFSITAGDTVARIAMDIIGELSDSNTSHQVVAVTVEVLHRMSGTTEAAYIVGDMATDQGILTDLSNLRGLSGVYELIGQPEIGRLDRVGNVLRWDVQFQIALTP